MSYSIGIYTRVSKQDGDKSSEQSKSIKNQKIFIEDYIKNNNDLIGSKIYYYSDDGFSGRNFNRPGIKALLEDVKSGKITCIITKDLSRFGRDYIEVNNYLDKIFPFFKLRFISINDNYDSYNNDGLTTDLDISFKNILYSYYSKDLSKKVKSGLISKAKEGKNIASFGVFGYTRNKETKKLEINPETAPIVEMIFNLVENGHTRSEVCKILNAQNIPTKSEYNIKNGIRKSYVRKVENKVWKIIDIHRILNDETYIGTTINFKMKTIKPGCSKRMKNYERDIIKIENTHEPIVSKETFERVKAKKRTHKRNNISKSIFAYKLKCGHCGYSLKFKSIYKDNEIINKKYSCLTKREVKESQCENIFITESELKEIVFEILKFKISSCVNNNINDKNIIDLENEKINEHNMKINALKISRQQLYEKYVENKITLDSYIKLKEEKENNINVILEKIQLSKDKIKHYKAIDNEKNFFKQYISEEQLTKKLVDLFVKCIYMYENNTIVIKWNLKEL